jgi:2-keto-4-pentenoate hydratase/2-oxohepta-3-ene-1,7-dioic acid hydratase in catechol pathway
MRYLTFSSAGDPRPRLGALRGDRILDVKAAVARGAGANAPATLLDLVQAGPNVWRDVATAIERSFAGGAGEAETMVAEQVHWHAPIPRPPRNVICLGLNYMSHVKETSKPLNRAVAVPEVPIFFTKATTAVSGPFDPIPWDPTVTQQVDYEAELAVVIGRAGKNIPHTRARDLVFGYTIVNDVSARDLQYQHKQWFKGKSLDGFCPMGPVVVTADEFGDPHAKRISLRVNGETRQDATTADMIFKVDAILEHLTRGFTVEPGDLIATGTPEGVALGRTPPDYLQAGDIIETEIEGIGTMRNRLEPNTAG